VLLEDFISYPYYPVVDPQSMTVVGLLKTEAARLCDDKHAVKVIHSHNLKRPFSSVVFGVFSGEIYKYAFKYP
jgi:hypothetical protein